MARPRKGEMPKKGRVDLPWRKDPIILKRLNTVSKMILEGARIWQIAEAFGYSLSSAHVDSKRVREMWAEDCAGEVNEHRQRSISHLQKIQAEAWAALRSEKAAKDSKGKGNPLTMRIIRECEADIINLQGTAAPIKKELAGKDGGPIQVETSVDLSLLSDEELEVFSALHARITAPKVP